MAEHRLIGEIADWYGVDADHLRIGDRADLSIIDPEHLDACLDEYAEERVAQHNGLSRMVNHNDDAVTAVFVSGRQVVDNDRPTEILGTVRTGSFLRAGQRCAPVPAPTNSGPTMSTAGGTSN